MRGRATQDEQTLRKADKYRAPQTQPEARKLLDLIAEELAAEYLRLVRADRERAESEGP
jgi:hypothetical protein